MLLQGKIIWLIEWGLFVMLFKGLISVSVLAFCQAAFAGSYVCRTYASDIPIQERGFLSCRTGPGVRNYAEIERLPENEFFTILGRDGSWFFVRTRTGRECYVYSKYVCDEGH
jgi:hypothetical protein